MSSQSTVESRSVDVSGHQIGYLDSGEGEQTLLMVHGNPVSSHVFARLIGELPARYRCIAPDLLGFGRSEKPEGEADYTLGRHSRIVAEFVRALDLQDVALVAHDWGGPIGVGAARRDRSRYARLVLLNTLTEAPMKIPLRYWVPFHVLLRTKRVSNYLIKERNLFQKVAVSDMDESDQAVYFRANDKPANRAGIAAFPYMIPHTQDHHTYPLLRTILSELKDWSISTLVLFSDGDNIFSVEQGKRLANQMQNAQFRLIPGAGHFLQYEKPDAVAASVDEFLRGNR